MAWIIHNTTMTSKYNFLIAVNLGKKGRIPHKRSGDSRRPVKQSGLPRRN
jgi:L,D-peptidoglycan transpeptidase YkuD (ErfK/YbiS/YcfS/YnhG family)